MKKTILLFLSLILAVSFSACAKTTDDLQADSTISRDRAIELALDHAGLSRDSAFNIEAERDLERDGLFWEVDFEDGDYEYSYDVNAKSGEVAKVDREKDD